MKSIKSLSIFVLILFCSTVSAQMATGDWRAHLAYHNATKSIKAFAKIYVLSDGAIYSYDSEDNSIYAYDKVNTLSDNNISDIAYCNTEKAIVIGYRNGNIDLLYEDDDIYNITDLNRSTLQDKKINEITVYGNKAYISTNSGIVVLDIVKKQISETYRFESAVLSSILYGNYLVCATQSGVFKGNIKDNLLDPSVWNVIDNRGIFVKLLEYDKKVVISVNDKNLFFIDIYSGKLTMIDNKVLNVSSDNGKLFVYKDNQLHIYQPAKDIFKCQIDYPVNNVTADGNYLWISSGMNGILKYTVKDNKLTVVKKDIIPDSPVRNYFDYMNLSDEGKLLVAGGSLNYSDIDYEGTLMYFKNNSWTNFKEDSIYEKTKLKYINLTSIVEDPKKNGHYFAGSARHGLYEYQDEKFIKLHTFDNSGLKTILPTNPRPYEFVSVDGLRYDNNNNLWMLNNEVDTIIRILKSDNTWIGLYYPEIANLPTFKQILFDSNGLVWTAATRYKPGIFCADINNTLVDQSDDRHAFSGANLTNQDGVTVTVNDIFFIEEDLNGVMWIGTDQGIFTLQNPKEFISESKHIFNRIKIPRNDGTGQADYLLNGVYTTSICIDFANRKWIGTMNNGLFLLDKTGTNTIEHFTVENSPLLSNYILNIKVNGDTGEVFIGTDKGLIVFGGDVVRNEEKLDKSKVTVFPNPILPENSGKISVRGLTDNCTVKILNSSGKLMYEGLSEGGSFVWNCDTSKWPSGMYFIMAVNEKGSSSIVSRFTIIR